jgi:hypothetical protein
MQVGEHKTSHPDFPLGLGGVGAIHFVDQ